MCILSSLILFYFKYDKRTYIAVTIKGTAYAKYGLPAQHASKLHDRFGNNHTRKSFGVVLSLHDDTVRKNIKIMRQKVWIWSKELQILAGFFN